MIRRLRCAGCILASLLLVSCGGETVDTVQAGKSDFTVAWFSDPQHYAEKYPGIYEGMTQWIADNAEKENIRYTLVTGDLVNDSSDEEQWQVADKSMTKLDGVMPYMTLAGNHDKDIGKNNSFSAYLKYFGSQRFDGVETVGGFYQDGIGRYDILEFGPRPILLISMGYVAGGDSMEWINRVLKQHRDKTAILAIHSYLREDNGLTGSGEDLFDDVVEENPNLRLVLCGHRSGVARVLTSFDDDGDDLIDRTVHQLLADYQDGAEGGSGYLCLLRFDGQNEQIHVQTYSPYKNDFNYYPDGLDLEEFTIHFPFSP